MCSFIVSNQPIGNLEFINEFARRRGPDGTTHANVGGLTFVHNLLSITGSFCQQPFVAGDAACVYNGEIYNFRQFAPVDSDGEVLLPLYTEYGEAFARLLDGEFAIVVADFARDRLVLCTDAFGTKPLFVGTDKSRIGVATYQSPLVRLEFPVTEKIPANTLRVYRLSTLDVLMEKPLYTFDLKQYKTEYDDWILAFERSMKKRCAGARERVFIGLSSGYDSGAIACEALRQGLSFNAYSIAGSENPAVLRARIARIKNAQLIELSRGKYEAARRYLREQCEEFVYEGYNFKNDKAAIGLSYVCSLARRDGCKILLSGQGADEVFSDYGRHGQRIFPHSCFGGRFPDDLSSVFPWKNFFAGTQIRYLNKEEYVAGSYGIEARYPFLDVDVVQEFLSLRADLKNTAYKAPLYAYLTRHGFPFDRDVKIGFQADRNLRWNLIGRATAYFRSKLNSWSTR